MPGELDTPQADEVQDDAVLAPEETDAADVDGDGDSVAEEDWGSFSFDENGNAITGDTDKGDETGEAGDDAGDDDATAKTPAMDALLARLNPQDQAEDTNPDETTDTAKTTDDTKTATVPDLLQPGDDIVDKVLAGMENAEELKEYFEDDPAQKAFFNAMFGGMSKLVTDQTAELQTIKAQLQEYQQREQQAAQAYENQRKLEEELTKADPKWREDANSPEFNQWLEKQPQAVQSVAYNATAETVGDVKMLLDAFREARAAEAAKSSDARLAKTRARRTAVRSGTLNPSRSSAKSASIEDEIAAGWATPIPD